MTSVTWIELRVVSIEELPKKTPQATGQETKPKRCRASSIGNKNDSEEIYGTTQQSILARPGTLHREGEDKHCMLYCKVSST